MMGLPGPLQFGLRHLAITAKYLGRVLGTDLWRRDGPICFCRLRVL